MLQLRFGSLAYKIASRLEGDRFRFWIATLSLLSVVSPTATQDKCDPNYENQVCVLLASDVDCAGSKGNGQTYVSGPVTFIGTVIYGIDRDNDGIGCERR